MQMYCISDMMDRKCVDLVRGSTKRKDDVTGVEGGPKEGVQNEKVYLGNNVKYCRNRQKI